MTSAPLDKYDVLNLGDFFRLCFKTVSSDPIQIPQSPQIPLRYLRVSSDPFQMPQSLLRSLSDGSVVPFVYHCINQICTLILSQVLWTVKDNRNTPAFASEDKRHTHEYVPVNSGLGVSLRAECEGGCSFQQVTESCWRTACPTSSSPPLALSSSIHLLGICPDKLSHAGSCFRQPPPISALHSCLVHRSAQHSFGEACSLRSVEIKPRRWQWPSPFSAGASGGIGIRENHRWWLAEVVLQCRGSPTETPLGTEANKDFILLWVACCFLSSHIVFAEFKCHYDDGAIHRSILRSDHAAH